MTHDETASLARLSDEVTKKIERDVRRQSFLTSTFFSLAVCFISLAIFIAMFALVQTALHTQDKLDDKDHVDAVAQARTECRNSFGVRVTDTKGTFDVAFANALLLGVDDTTTPADLDAAKKDLISARDEYNKAVNARKQYEADGAPLPCPIAVSVPPSPAAASN